MKNFLVISLVISLVVIISGKPANNNVEIEKQRLVKFPEDPFQYQTSQQSEETKRILDEIERINQSLGYVKKQEAHIPAILDSSQYLYPKPAYHPLNFGYNNGAKLEPSIRSLRLMREPHPVRRRSRSKKPMRIAQIYELPVMAYPAHQTHQYARSKAAPRVIADLENYYDYSSEEAKPKPYQLYFIPAKPESRSKKSGKKSAKEWQKLDISSASQLDERQRMGTKVKEVRPKVTFGGTSSTPRSTTSNSVKSPISSFFNNPFRPAKADSHTHPKSPAPASPILIKPQPIPSTTTPPPPKVDFADDYDQKSSEETSEEGGAEKNLFATIKKAVATTQETQKEAIKEGGIIIQRLKVRKGGIAIAGPGGVATAGSGGTAIVGPGGYALTHPRSLTIAGPGAKIISLPESTDLKEALLRTEHGKSLPVEGRIVATGPAIYYNNPDN